MGANISNDSGAIYDLLRAAKVIAVVGYSDKPDRDSYQVAAYLRRAGYTVIPVNSTVDQIDGKRSYKSLRDVPGKVDIVSVFRANRHIPGIVEDAIAIGAKVVWTQLGLEHKEAMKTATAEGIDVVVNRCIKIEHQRLQL